MTDALQGFIDSVNRDLTIELFSTTSQLINYIGASGLSKSALLIIGYKLPGISGLDLKKQLSVERKELQRS